MQKRWEVHSITDKELINRLSEELGTSEMLTNLLVQRGIKTYEDARSFFKPNLQDIHNPYLMQDMKKSVERIEQAIINREKILIFGDYDVDGTSAVALVYSFLKNMTDNIEYYVPDRYTEGYGISIQSVEYAKEHNFSLIIALDCGIRCHCEIDLAVQYSIDVIVCDHHLPDKTLPNAYAVLDPKRTDCHYPYKELSGCGVGFKLVQAIAQNKNIPLKELGQYLDLLALSIASDIVPITGENRIFAYWGLRLINERPRLAIESLLAYNKIIRKINEKLPPKNTVFVRKITIRDLVFTIGPRINAAGRMDMGRNSANLLITNDINEITALGERIDAHNNKRKELDAKTTDDAISMISSELEFKTKKSLAVYNSSWSKGIVGIVASRLVEHFYKPSIVLTLFDNMITGSARSVKGFDIHTALSQCKDLLERFGGHAFAAGLSLKPENLTAFIEKFEQIVTSTIPENLLVPSIEIDAEIALNQIDTNLFNVLKNFSPFGPENLQPLFMTKNVICMGDVRIVGENHLKLSLFQANNRSYFIDAIAFDLGQYYERIAKGEPFHICYHIDINEWQGKSSLQLNIKDIKFLNA